jgi:hypothetical protein
MNSVMATAAWIAIHPIPAIAQPASRCGRSMCSKETDMRLETVVDAMLKAKDNRKWMDKDFAKHDRQYRAFRARILWNDGVQKEAIRLAQNYINWADKRIAELEKERAIDISELEKEREELLYEANIQFEGKDSQIAAKDKRIAEMEGLLSDKLGLTIDQLNVLLKLTDKSWMQILEYIADKNKRIAELEERIKSWEDLQGF